MNTTLNKILEHDPCHDGWNLLLHNLGKTKADNKPLSFKRILESNGIKDAVWALITIPYVDRCMFQHDVAMLVIDNFEKLYPNDKRPRLALESIKKYHNGEITEDELSSARLEARSAMRSAAWSAAWSAASAAWAASSLVLSSAWAVAESAASAELTESTTWPKIKKLFIKHFC